MEWTRAGYEMASMYRLAAASVHGEPPKQDSGAFLPELPRDHPIDQRQLLVGIRIKNTLSHFATALYSIQKYVWLPGYRISNYRKGSR